MEERRIPGSLRSVEDTAPWLVGGTGVSLTAAMLSSVHHADEAVLGMLLVAVPILTVMLAANRFAAAGGRSGAKTLAAGITTYAVIATMLAAGLGGAELFWIGPVLAAMISAFVFVLALPALLLAYAFGKSKARDRGDAMLLWGSVWSAVMHALCIMLAWDHPEQLTMWAALAGLVVSVLVLAGAVTRAQNRRTFVKLAIAGQVPGYRVRTKASLEELRELPVLYSVYGAPRAVLERVMVSMEGSAYRGGVTAEPVAVIPLTTR